MRSVILVFWLPALVLGGCGSSPALVELHGRPALPMTSRWQRDANDAAESLEQMRNRPAPSSPDLRPQWIQEVLGRVEDSTMPLDRLHQAGVNERLYASIVWGTIIEELLSKLAPGADLSQQPELQRVLAPYARLAHGAFQVCAAQTEAAYHSEWARYCEARATQYGWSKQVALQLIRPPELGEALARMPDPAWPPGAALGVLRIMPDEDGENGGFVQEDMPDE